MLQNYYYNANNFQLTLPLTALGAVEFIRSQCVRYPKDFDSPSDVQISHLLSLAKEPTTSACKISEERHHSCYLVIELAKKTTANVVFTMFLVILKTIGPDHFRNNAAAIANNLVKAKSN